MIVRNAVADANLGRRRVAPISASSPGQDEGARGPSSKRNPVEITAARRPLLPSQALAPPAMRVRRYDY
jgi:hypothetical protein